MKQMIIFFIMTLLTLGVQSEEKKEIPIKFKTLDSNNQFINADPEKYDFEVIYFFSYACPYCHEFQPYMDLWVEKGKKENTALTKIPVQFKKNWEGSAIAFEIAKRLDIEEEMTDKIYKSMHENNRDMFDKNDLYSFFVEEMEVEPSDFNKHYNSFSLRIKLQKYKELVEKFEVMGTPSLVLISKRGTTFITSPSIAGHPVNMVTTIDFITTTLGSKY